MTINKSRNEAAGKRKSKIRDSSIRQKKDDRKDKEGMSHRSKDIPVEEKLRPSIWNLVYTIFLDEIFFGFIILLIFLGTISINFLTQTGTIEIPWSIVLSILAILNFITVFISYYNWRNTYYYFDKKNYEIIFVRRFIFFKRISVYTINENADVKLFQGLLGKILNFGTLKIVGPTIKEPLYIRNIGEPEKSLAAVEKVIREQDKDTNLIETGII